MQEVGVADVPVAVKHVLDPARVVSVLLVSVASDTGLPRVDPALLSNELAGGVQVSVFTDMATAHAWTDAVEEDLRAYGGAIRLVNPVGSDDPGGVFLTYPGTDPMLTVRRIARRLAHPWTAPVKQVVAAPSGLPSVRAVVAPGRPTPNVLYRGPARAVSVRQPEPPAPDLATAGLDVAALDGQSTALLTVEVAELRAELTRQRERADANEREVMDSWEEIQHRDEEIQRLTDSGAGEFDEVYGRRVFADREQQFRHVLSLRALLTLVEDERPLDAMGRLRIGPRWLDDLDELPSVSTVRLTKVLDGVLEVLTGRVWDHPGRDTHQQRTGSGGEDPVLLRADGAVAWRANLQHKTPQARRLLWWAVPDGSVELARVAAHDDYRMA